MTYLIPGAEWVLNKHPREAQQYMKEAADSGAPIEDCIEYFAENMRNLLVRDLQYMERRAPKTEDTRCTMALIATSFDDVLESPYYSFESYVWDKLPQYYYRTKESARIPEVERIPYHWKADDEYNLIGDATAERQLEAVREYLERWPNTVKDSDFIEIVEGVAMDAAYDYIHEVCYPLASAMDPGLIKVLKEGLSESGTVSEPKVSPLVYDYANRVLRDYIDSVDKPNRTLGAANRAKSSGAASRGTTHSAIKASRASKTGSKSVKSKACSKSVKSKTGTKKPAKKPTSRSKGAR